MFIFWNWALKVLFCVFVGLENWSQWCFCMWNSVCVLVMKLIFYLSFNIAALSLRFEIGLKVHLVECLVYGIGVVSIWIFWGSGAWNQCCESDFKIQKQLEIWSQFSVKIRLWLIQSRFWVWSWTVWGQGLSFFWIFWDFWNFLEVFMDFSGSNCLVQTLKFKAYRVP